MGRFFKRLAAETGLGWHKSMSLEELAEGLQVKQNRRGTTGDDFPGEETYEVALIERGPDGETTGIRAVGTMGGDWWIDDSTEFWVEDVQPV